MNGPITNLFRLVLVLFVLLVAFTSRWSVFDASTLAENPSNRRELLEEQRRPRGLLLADDGSKLAESQPIGTGQARRYVRRYPDGSLFSHAVGYSFVDRGRAGLEQSRNGPLTGDRGELASIVDELVSEPLEGSDVRTALDAKAQRVALQGLGGRAGSIVVIEPESGRVPVMVSTPNFDPNQIPERFSQLNRAAGSPIFNRATQARYPPGSTMKVVTAAAALDSGRFTPNSVIDGRSPKTVGGVPLNNFGNESFGAISLTQALTNSVNTVWGSVAEQLGKGTVYRYMKRFGFNENPPIDYPENQLTPSGVFDAKSGKLLDEDDAVDIGRVGIGQERLQVTPLQMAEVAATVANGGVRMEPRLTERIVGADGRTKRRISPERATRVMSKGAADQLKAMMASVVREGSGTAAALEGIKVAGKTGTAEVDNGASNQAWFIGFAPLDDPKMAVAVTVERTQGQGGTVAAPIAKRVLQALIRRG